MPRSIQAILDNADELAKRFEDHEPDPNDERPVEEYVLDRAALARARGERQIVDSTSRPDPPDHGTGPTPRRNARNPGPT